MLLLSRILFSFFLLSFFLKEREAFSNEDKAERLYQKLFAKEKKQREITFSVPLEVNGKVRGRILVQLNSSGEVEKVGTEKLLKVLEVLLIEESYKKIEEKFGHKQLLTIEEIEESFLSWKFDSYLQKFFLEVEVTDRKQQKHKISRTLPQQILQGEQIEQAPLSAFLNWRLSETYIPKRLSGATERRQPLRLEFDGALQLNRWAWEGRFFYNEGERTKWYPGDIRVIKDNPESMLRVALGDITIDSVGYQESISHGGFALSKAFFLQPSYISHPLGESNLYLEVESEVEVWVNGTLIKKFDLERGYHNFSDFNFSAGYNDVEYHILDGFGRKRIIKDSQVIDEALLKRGLSKYAFSVGLPGTIEDGAKRYDTDNPMLNFFYKKGYFDHLTLGSFLQMDIDQKLFGVTATVAPPLGLIEWSAALSKSDHYASDYATKLFWNSLSSTRNFLRPYFTLSLEYLGKNFAKVGDSVNQEGIAYNLRGSVTKKFTSLFQSSLHLSSEVRRAAQSDTYKAILRFKKKWAQRWKGWNGSLDLTHARLTSGRDEESAIIRLDYFFPRRDHHIHYAYRSKNRAHVAKWNFEPTAFNKQFYGDISLESNEAEDRANANFRRNGDKYYASLSNNSKHTPGATENRLSVNIASSIVYADGGWAFSRPVQDSFLIIQAGDSLGENLVGINPTNEVYQQVAQGYKSAVLHQLTSYQRKKVALFSPTLPYGKELKEVLFVVEPSYKSGALLEVEAEQMVIIQGEVTDEKAKALGFKTGKIYPLDSEEKAILFFTNQKGIFKMGGFKAGSYRLELYDEGYEPFFFDVDDSSFGLIKLPPIRLKERP